MNDLGPIRDAVAVFRAHSKAIDLDGIREDVARLCEATARQLRGGATVSISDHTDLAMGFCAEIALAVAESAIEFLRSGLVTSSWIYDSAAVLIRAGWSRGDEVRTMAGENEA